MYEAYEYTQRHGILLRGEYASYRAGKGNCEQPNKFHFKNNGQDEIDEMSNEELRAHVYQQPIGVGIFASSMLQSYRSGIVTDKYLHCSNASNEVNHGVVIVGYGRHHRERSTGQCDWYWIIRNSWGGTWGEDGFFKLCADDAFTANLPYGTCLVN